MPAGARPCLSDSETITERRWHDRESQSRVLPEDCVSDGKELGSFFFSYRNGPFHEIRDPWASRFDHPAEARLFGGAIR